MHSAVLCFITTDTRWRVEATLISTKQNMFLFFCLSTVLLISSLLITSFCLHSSISILFCYCHLVFTSTCILSFFSLSLLCTCLFCFFSLPPFCLLSTGSQRQNSHLSSMTRRFSTQSWGYQSHSHLSFPFPLPILLSLHPLIHSWISLHSPLLLYPSFMTTLHLCRSIYVQHINSESPPKDTTSILKDVPEVPVTCDKQRRLWYMWA